MRIGNRRLPAGLAFSLLLFLLLAGTAVVRLSAQSLGELAREARKKKAETTSEVWTNETLGHALPTIRLLAAPRAHPPSLSGYEPTPFAVVRQMLALADVEPGEVVFDIGSGDGRIVIMAAEEFGALGVGIELDEKLVAVSRQGIARRGLQDRVTIVHANALDVDLSPADVVTLYLEPPGLKILRPHLEHTLQPGTRVVSRTVEVPGWTPVNLPPEGEPAPLFLYRVP